MIRSLDVSSLNAPRATVLNVGIPLNPIATVESVTMSKSEGFSMIGSMYVSGDCSNVVLNRMVEIRVGGNLSNVALKTHPLASPILSGEVEGNLLGFVHIESGPNGSIGAIDVLTIQGTVGTPSNFADIRVDGWLGRLTAAEINANIRELSTQGAADSYVDQIFLMRAEKINGSSGTIRGEIRGRMTEFPDQAPEAWIVANGDLEADIYIGGGFREKINLFSEIAARNVGGLKGQIVINGLDINEAWTSDVRVGPGNPLIVLDGNSYPEPGEYPNTAASLGGGSVGVVPFRLHRTDCAPVDNSQVLDMNDRPSGSNPVKVRFYGPVNWDTEGTTQPFKIERRGIGSTGAWSNVSSCFTQTLDTSNDTIVKLTPTGALTPLPRGYEYRLTLNRRGDSTPVLRSNIPTRGVATDPAVHEFAWVDNQGNVTGTPLKFSICNSNAAGDADDSGTVNFSDTTSVLANFGLSGCNLGDADRSGTVDFADLTSVLANFGSMYCVSSGLRFAGEGEKFGVGRVEMHSSAITTAVAASSVISSALLSMGYESIDAFVGTISQMSEADRNAEVRRLGEMLEAGAGGVD